MICEISSKNGHIQYNEDGIYKKQGEGGGIEGYRDKAENSLYPRKKREVKNLSIVQKVRLFIFKSKIIEKFEPIFMNRCDTYF